ncbi:MAG: lipopolysaccharide biosynthesis protein [Bacteroidaceae bacterium]|nr:lipopolysaccharide biosynthesis protein [Bacteroidaceae bacterium]
MAKLQSLVKDTAIYGLSSIVGRFLNYLLVPLYTSQLSAASGGYGIITNVYAYTALILVFLTFGMETTFFRFANKENEKPMEVYSTTLIFVGSMSLLFAIAILAFIHPIAGVMGYADHPEYIGMMAVVVAFDAFQAIPFAFLRYQKRPIKFAFLKLLFIAMNILLNLCYFLWFPALYKSYPEIMGHIYNPGVGVGYAFAINLLCTASITVWFGPELTGFKYKFNKELFKSMLKYSWPLVILGLAGILNQTADKMLFPFLSGVDGKQQLGIYGAASKIAMIMAMITQAFRYAYEPFVFGRAKDKDAKEMYASAMKYFLIFTLLAFLCVVFYLDILKHIIAPDYWEGLQVVPIVMAAEIMMGIYFNLSFWYKLIDDTKWGAIFSFIGCAVLVLINYIFVPKVGYIACAWGGFAGYFTAMTLSYVIGQKKNPIHYDMKGMSIYVLMTVLLFAISQNLPHDWNMWVKMGFNTLLLMIFIAYVVKYDFPLSQLPVVGKFFRK